jgi:hypothetical protein
MWPLAAVVLAAGMTRRIVTSDWYLRTCYNQHDFLCCPCSNLLQQVSYWCLFDTVEPALVVFFKTVTVATSAVVAFE